MSVILVGNLFLNDDYDKIILACLMVIFEKCSFKKVGVGHDILICITEFYPSHMSLVKTCFNKS